MPKGDKSISAIKASNVADQGNTSPGGASTPPSAILEAIATLKSELKEDNDKLRKDINNMGQEMGKKLDNLTEEMRGLTERMDEAEIRVGRVEDMTLDLTEALTESIKRQRSIQNKLTDLESRSRRNNIRLFADDHGVVDVGADDKDTSSSTPPISDHQKHETSTSAAGDNETEQGDNVSVEVDANNNELRQPSADQPEISGLASTSSPTLHAVDIPAYTNTDPGTWDGFLVESVLKVSDFHQAKRYLVSTSELQRRCSPPECYSNNTVVSYLRKAKAKKRNIEEKLTGLGVQPTKRTKLTSLCTKLCEDECSELVSDVMFLAAKFMPQKKVVQEMCENEDIHDSISKAESCR
ncbi:hypothetical protein E1301_Tti016761 [Triplophysa tibetana]|uniref:Transcription factor AP-2 C-terminal domain-containing protein n=1 Tax=Triplophysa tibetana TaxID=1572043 RepID=A0A5A9P8Y9_9TELE|nr:hypothetical protein E1301_Tti016761 [Triplophysa tibetana]